MPPLQEGSLATCCTEFLNLPCAYCTHQSHAAHNIIDAPFVLLSVPPAPCVQTINVPHVLPAVLLSVPPAA